MKVITEYKDHDRLLIAVDCIIFGFDGNDLKALLVKRNFEPGLGKWSLMGGFIKANESVDQGANRVLSELTGLSDIYMEQLHCYGDVERDPGGRVVSIAYFALIKINGNASIHERGNAKWFSIKKVPALIFDHKEMVKMAKERLREKAAKRPIGFELLPEKFTLPQLQSLYEAIYETQFDKGNFSRKMLSLKILKKLNTKERAGSKKGAFHYVFDHEKYQKQEKESLRFV